MSEFISTQGPGHDHVEHASAKIWQHFHGSELDGNSGSILESKQQIASVAFLGTTKFI
jgi:hypothetical protein